VSDSTDEKLDRIIELLGAIVETLERLEGNDYTFQVYNELGSILSSVQAIETMISDQTPD
jgi:hypothetical protein